MAVEELRVMAFLQELCFWEPQDDIPQIWETAIDPKSGRSYYYDVISRVTQWEKPAILREREKAAKRKKLRDFFTVMEANLKRSIANGKLIPEATSKTAKKEKELPPLQLKVRTISGIHEDVFKQQQQRPPLPVPAKHVRRYTDEEKITDSLHAPNVDATIHAVCSVVRHYIVSSTTFPHKRSVFCESSNTIPTLSAILRFYRGFYKSSQMEFDAIIVSLIYMERLIKKSSVIPNVRNWKSVIFSTLMLASKVWDDLSMWNVDFSNICEYNLQRINQLELGILVHLKFEVAIPASEYAKYYYMLRNLMIKGGVYDKSSVQTISKSAERRTSRFQANLQRNSVDWSMIKV